MQSTSLEQELHEQKKWKCIGSQSVNQYYQNLLRNEFLPEQERVEFENKIISGMFRYLSKHLPYYQNLFSEHNIDPVSIREIKDFELIPTLNRRKIRKNYDKLKSTALPHGDTWSLDSYTSGHTSKVTRFRQTKHSRLTDQTVIQRHFRWMRLNPNLTMGFIYEDQPIVNYWPGIGRHFKTGNFLGISINNDLDHMLNWIREEKLDYLRIWPTVLEQLCFTLPQDHDIKLKGLRISGGLLTPAMEQRIQQTFPVPITLGYGLDELGWVAARCPEANRYHVHSENCIVEIVDKDKKASKAGQYGEILITKLNNFGMPLLRLETGDMAKAVDSPCPCGRSLPSFEGPIYPKINYRKLRKPIRHVVHNMLDHMSLLPIEYSKLFNKYQLRRTSETDFSLLINAPISDSLASHLQTTWNKLNSEIPKQQLNLSLKQVDDIPKEIGGKIVNYADER